jgi:hypothetical protein
MIEGDFDRWTLANMNAALDEVCRNLAHGEEHAVRKRIARQIIKCAKGGGTTLSELTGAAQRALIVTSDGNKAGIQADMTRIEPKAACSA